MKILCVCTGNTKTSPMMAALLAQKCTEERIDAEIESAGISSAHTNQPAHPLAIECMEAYEIDINSHKSKWVGELDPQTFSLILCTEDSEAEYLKNKYDQLPPIKVMGVSNPVGKDIQTYYDCADRIQDILEMLQPLIKYTYSYKQIGTTS